MNEMNGCNIVFRHDFPREYVILCASFFESDLTDSFAVFSLLTVADNMSKERKCEMKGTGKRILSVSLSVMMALGMPSGTFAATPDEAAAGQVSEAEVPAAEPEVTQEVSQQAAEEPKAEENVEKEKNEEQISYDHSVWKDIKKELFSNKVALVSVIVLLIIIIASILAPLSPYDPNKINVTEKLQGISAKHILGTDEYGRDYFTRALYGGRISLSVGFCSMIMTVIIGTVIGITAGYFGGKIDMLLMRFTDIFLALPSMLLMVVLNTILRPGIFTLIAVLSLFSWAQVARITRAETMSVKERDYVTAARNLGAGNLRIAIEHIVPNIMGPIIVAASLGVANAILMESSLSFLGLGVQIPRASWGSMLQSAQGHILDAPYLAVFPGVLILCTVLSFNLLGDVLRTALEPKIVK